VAIVDRFRTPLQRYCSGIVGPTRAEDAVQQTLISAHDALKRTTEVRHLRSWLYRIAHNTSLNVLRSVRDDVPLDSSHAAVGDGPHAAFERTERLRETLAVVQELPERQRAALLLRELEGRSHEEIATALGVTTGSARQNLMRARATVRGAVTAVTPYPLVAKLATGLASAPAAAGWSEAAAGAGASATIAKLTAGVMATGALVGGAVGTQQVVHRDHRSATPAVADAAAPKRHAKAAASRSASGVAVPVADPAAPAQRVTRLTGSRTTTGTAHRNDQGTASNGGDHRPASSGGSGGSGSGGSGSNDGATDDSSRRHQTNRDDSSSGSGSGDQSETSGGDGGGSSGGRVKREGDNSERSGSGTSRGDGSGDQPSSSGGGSDDAASHDAPAPTTTTTAPATTPSGDGGDGEGGSSRHGSGSGTSATVPETVTVPPPLHTDGG
jgi:RNA polymerase sigma factor (sigma-70 family)